ncbi:CDP-glucose 4,6-dehydratase [Pollutimonas sp. H1-120]|uniref:CDP-glucose 4,6-dehydratase n=1 Tax=Pollutimonas sp. H1-120 TaxID=3148824 RepID=UPI003B519C48
MESLVKTSMVSPKFWKGKRVLLTGHTGFKGGWLALWLAQLGARVTGIALPPNTAPNLYALADIEKALDSNFCDIRDAVRVAGIVRQAKPEIVFHMAAQPLVRASYEDPIGTFASNVQGTVHVLDALRGIDSVRIAVMITTDKVYSPQQSSYPYRETDRLGGHDPYSASKAASELVIESYRSAFLSAQGVAVASARAGNVIGGGDWSIDRLIPDAVRAWQSNSTLEIRRPQAIRPWQHVLEPLSGYLALAERLWDTPSLPTAYNFGPTPHEAATVSRVVSLAREVYGCGNVRYSDDINQGPYEAGWLALETSLSRNVLGIYPRWSLREAVERTVLWYRSQNEGMDARLLCEADIAAYMSASI